MSLAKRLGDMDRRIRVLEEFNKELLNQLHEDAELVGADQSVLTLDGDEVGGDRDQTQSLG